MEPNIDRSMWGVIVLIIAVVVGVLAKDKIYDAVEGIFSKQTDAISNLDVGDLGGTPQEETLVDELMFMYQTNFDEDGNEYAEISSYDFEYMNQHYGGVMIDHLVMPDTYQGLPIKKISGMGFGSSGHFKSVVLPKFLEEIGVATFSNNPNLMSVTFPSTLKLIGYGAFLAAGFDEITLPESTQYELGAFEEGVIIHGGQVIE